MSDTESTEETEGHATGADLIRDVLRPQQWGLPLPEGVIPLARWGARAIYKTSEQKWRSRGPRGGRQGYYERLPAVVDLLHDRMSATGNNSALKLLGKWLDGTALPWLRKTIDLPGNSAESIRFEADVTAKAPTGLSWPGHCVMIASPNASHGYLYIGAWIVPL